MKKPFLPADNQAERMNIYNNALAVSAKFSAII
jgi:hypothetical protein